MKKRLWISGCLLLLTAPSRAQTLYLSENFDAGMPSGWTVTVPTCGNSSGDSTRWMATTDGWRGMGLAAYSLDSTEFAVIDSDLPGAFCLSDDYLTSPAMDPTASPVVYLDFDHHYKHSLVGSAAVEVFDGSAWVPVASYTVTTGAWMNPDHASVDVSQYNNPNFRVRFRYQANWDWFWAVDNVTVSEPGPTGMPGPPVLAARVFPNPAAEWLNVSLVLPPGEKACIAVCDVTGNTWMKTVVVGRVPALDIRALPDGVYVVEIQAGKASHRTRFVKRQ